MLSVKKRESANKYPGCRDLVDTWTGVFFALLASSRVASKFHRVLAVREHVQIVETSGGILVQSIRRCTSFQKMLEKVELEMEKGHCMQNRSVASASWALNKSIRKCSRGPESKSCKQNHLVPSTPWDIFGTSKVKPLVAAFYYLVRVNPCYSWIFSNYLRRFKSTSILCRIGLLIFSTS